MVLMSFVTQTDPFVVVKTLIIIMLCAHLNEKEAFSATMTATAEETSAALSQRRKELSQVWDGIDAGWQGLQQRMTDIGITKASPPEEGMMRLNVGGSHLHL